MTGVMPADVMPLWQSWQRTLRAEGKSPNTIDSYRLAVQSFSRWCEANGRPTDPTKQRRADVGDFIVHLIETRTKGTAGTRFRGLHAWFRWLLAEDEIDADPMAGLKQPRPDEVPPPVLSDEQLVALLDTCAKGRDWLARRDYALLRLLIDTGMRRSEVAALTLADVDLEGQAVVIRTSKTRRGRIVPIGAKATQALDRYLRMRAKHAHADLPNLWLGWRGPLGGEGVRQAVQRRAEQAGLSHVFVHQFRHTFAHHWLLNGGQEHDAAAIAGWTGTAMLARYGASAASERARQAHRRLGHGDRL
jgi:site-specific recombinase XerD